MCWHELPLVQLLIVACPPVPCHMQGAIDPRRRNYDAAFAAAAHPAVVAELLRRNESLLLVGHLTPKGLPPMPRALAPHVQVLADLAFKVRAPARVFPKQQGCCTCLLVC